MLGLLKVSFSASQPVNHAVNKEVIFFISLVCIYMLFAGWEVRIVKNCDRGLENAARGHRLKAAFSRPRSQCFAIRTDLIR